jgi:hypothetical protein
VERTKSIIRNIHTFDEQLSVVKITIPFRYGDLSLTDGFYL